MRVVDAPPAFMVRMTLRADASVLNRKADAFEREIKSRKIEVAAPDDSSNQPRPVPQLAIFEPVQPGFYDFVKRRMVNSETFLTSRKIGRYRIHWPTMSEDLGEMEKFAGEKALLGPSPDQGSAPFDPNNWDEPDRMVVPVDSFERYLDLQKAKASNNASSLWRETWTNVLHAAVVGFAIRYGLGKLRGAGGFLRGNAGAAVQAEVADAAKKAGFE